MYDDPLAIGNLARAFCGVTRAQIDIALQLQGTGCIGAALLRIGALTQDQLASLLRRQWALRNGLVSADDVSALVDYAIRGVNRLGVRWDDAVRSMTRAAR